MGMQVPRGDPGGMGWDGMGGLLRARVGRVCAVFPTGEPWLPGGEAEPRRASSARELASGHVLSPMRAVVAIFKARPATGHLGLCKG